MKKARYNRISSANQNLERQLVRNHPDEIIYNDTISGAVAFAEREQGKELLEAVKEGSIDYLSVSSVDRLGRSLYDILTTLEFLNNHNVILKIDNLGLESLVNGKPSHVFKLILSMMGTIAEMERENLRERQLEGIALAKAKGVYKGRERGTSMTDDEFLEKYKNVVKEIKNHPDLSIRKIGKMMGVSVGTVQRLKKTLSLQAN